jgi:acetyltransferase-like isoleucine patch superfamily enzyme
LLEIIKAYKFLSDYLDDKYKKNIDKNLFKYQEQLSRLYLDSEEIHFSRFYLNRCLDWCLRNMNFPNQSLSRHTLKVYTFPVYKWLKSMKRLGGDIVRRSFNFIKKRNKISNSNSHSSKFNQLNLSVFVDSSVQVLGWNNVRIENNSIVSEDTWININHRDENLALLIGQNCFIGRRNFFTTGKLIKIGDYCLTGVDCKFLGSGHAYDSPFIPYIAAPSTKDGVIEIGVNCWLGAGVTILKNVEIGYGSIIGAATMVNQSIPPLSVVVGNPCRVIKRYDMQRQAWVKVKDYPDDGDSYLMSEEAYLEILKKTPINMEGFRIAASKAFGDI